MRREIVSVQKFADLAFRVRACARGEHVLPLVLVRRRTAMHIGVPARLLVDAGYTCAHSACGPQHAHTVAQALESLDKDRAPCMRRHTRVPPGLRRRRGERRFFHSMH